MGYESVKVGVVMTFRTRIKMVGLILLKVSCCIEIIRSRTWSLQVFFLRLSSPFSKLDLTSATEIVDPDVLAETRQILTVKKSCVKVKATINKLTHIN